MEEVIGKWLGRRITEIREKKGIRQNKLANEVGIPASHLSKIESGQTSIKVNTLDKIAKVLNRRIDLVENGIDPNMETILLKLDNNEIHQTLRDILMELVKNNNDYIMRTILSHEVAKHFKREMSELEKEYDFKRDDTFDNQYAENHIMYKLDSYSTEDKELNCKLTYEFLIEFKTTDSSSGIYYGCKVIIKDENKPSLDRTKEITAYLDKQLQEIKESMFLTLNNTFPGINFEKLALKATNANKNTYWQFWFKLENDKHIIKVAARALRIIQRIYKNKLDLRSENIPNKEKKEKPVTRYTMDAYTNAIKQLSKIAKEKSVTSKLISYYEKFIAELESKKILVVDEYYEKAWKLNNLEITEFMQLIYLFFEHANKYTKDENVQWQCFDTLILGKDSQIIKNLAKLYFKATSEKNDTPMECKNKKPSIKKDIKNLFEKILKNIGENIEENK